jgi:Fe-S cluster assembly iron-binding protein IscA
MVLVFVAAGGLVTLLGWYHRVLLPRHYGASYLYVSVAITWVIFALISATAVLNLVNRQILVVPTMVQIAAMGFLKPLYPLGIFGFVLVYKQARRDLQARSTPISSVRTFCLVGLCVLGTWCFLSAFTRFVVVVWALSGAKEMLNAGRLGYFVGMLVPSAVCFALAGILGRSKVAATVVNSEERRKVVFISPTAADYAASTIAGRNYPSDTVLRIVESDDSDAPYEVKYDVGADADRDWIDESGGVVVVVDKTLAERVEGLTIDIRDGKYVFEHRLQRPE